MNLNAVQKTQECNIVNLLDYIKKKEKINRDSERDKVQERLATGKKSNGVPIATKSESLRTRQDIETIINYLSTHGKGNIPHRNVLVFKLGLATGLRASDIVRIKIRYLIDENGEFRDKFPVIETKTHKLNKLKVTEAVKQAVAEFFEATNWDYLNNGDSYLITTWGKINNSPVAAKDISDIFTEMGKNLDLGIKIGSHTMRHTFSEIHMRYGDLGEFDYDKLRALQLSLNHDSIETTMNYAGITDKIKDANKEVVSDFLVGKIEDDTIFIPNNEEMR